MSEWISVNDRLPAKGKDVLFTGTNIYGNRYEVQRGYFDGTNWRCSCCHEMLKGGAVCTHWMPLPELPKEGT